MSEELARKIIGWAEDCAADTSLLVSQIASEIEAYATRVRLAAFEDCRLVAFDRHMDVSSDFDEGYDSAVTDIVDAISALAAPSDTSTDKGEK